MVHSGYDSPYLHSPWLPHVMAAGPVVGVVHQRNVVDPKTEGSSPKVWRPVAFVSVAVAWLNPFLLITSVGATGNAFERLKEVHLSGVCPSLINPVFPFSNFI